mgnify:CR=1 FL=1
MPLRDLKSIDLVLNDRTGGRCPRNDATCRSTLNASWRGQRSSAMQPHSTMVSLLAGNSASSNVRSLSQRKGPSVARSTCTASSVTILLRIVRMLLFHSNSRIRPRSMLPFAFSYSSRACPGHSPT